MSPKKERALTAMPYLGGKSAEGMGSGPWVANQLPYRKGYLEPFAGMLGVLLQRNPSPSEIVNDVNSRITNWWTQVRDNHEELQRRLAATPWARDEFDNALANVDSHEDLIERARMLTVILMYGMMHTPDTSPSSFVMAYGAGPNFKIVDKLPDLAARIRNIQIENLDVNKLLKKIKNKPDLVIYCDPPYKNTAGYSDHPFDFVEFEELLKEQKGAVAVSGYADDYDGLLPHGWHKTVRTSTVAVGQAAKSSTHSKPIKSETSNKRKEALWMNYEPDGQLF